MGLRQWSIPTSPPDVATISTSLRKLQGLLGRTPVWTESRIVTASTTITDSDDVLLVSTASGAVTVTLPAASTVQGRRFTVKKMDVSVNNVTLDGNGAETIDGAATFAWSTQYAAYTIQSAITAAPATYGWVIL